MADKKNEKKYRETIEKLGITSKEWENTGVMLNLEIPTPPNPSNYENLLEYRRTHVLRPAIVQSEATIYLHERGYQLGIDYQAYQAIEIVNKLQEYERENSLPEIPTKSLSAGEIDLDVLNISRNTEKRRHTSVKPKHKKIKGNGYFNNGSFKNKQSKTKSSGKNEVTVADIAKKINDNCATGKPKARFNTIRRQSFHSQPIHSNRLFSSENSRPLEIKGLGIHNRPFSYHQSPGYQPLAPTHVMPSAPPMPPDYHPEYYPNTNFTNQAQHNPQSDTTATNTNSNSSVDSLFDSEEMKQFEKKYNPQKAKNNEVQYRSNQKKYNGIYPQLNNTMQESERDGEGEDFCSI